MISAYEINDADRLANCRLAWNALLSQTPGASFFQSLDWLEVYWRHFGHDQRLRVTVVRNEDGPLGILPLVVRTEASRVGPVRVLTYPLHDWATFYGPVGPNPTATLLAGLRHLRNTPRDWDMLDLRWVDRDGCDRGRTPRTMAQVGFQPCPQAWDRAAIVELDSGWDEYWQGRDTKFRAEAQRYQRRLAEQGTVRLLRYRPAARAQGEGDPRWDLYEACVELARQSWQGAADDGTTLSHGEVAGFFRDAHEAAARAGALDLNLLLLDERPIAFCYNYHYDGRVYGLRKGFEPRFSRLGPGTVLQRMMLEDGCRRGDRCYDLGVGSLASKLPWQTRLVTSYRFTHFPAMAARAQLLRLNRWLRKRICGAQDVACAQGS